jgi:hypothetical protein
VEREAALQAEIAAQQATIRDLTQRLYRTKSEKSTRLNKPGASPLASPCKHGQQPGSLGHGSSRAPNAEGRPSRAPQSKVESDAARLCWWLDTRRRMGENRVGRKTIGAGPGKAVEEGEGTAHPRARPRGEAGILGPGCSSLGVSAIFGAPQLPEKESARMARSSPTTTISSSSA